MSEEAVQRVVHELCEFGETGALIKDDVEKPWEIREEPPLLKSDFLHEDVKQMDIVHANMLYLKKEELSPKAINKIKRLAAFKNPEFYRAQAMRRSVYNTPRIISVAEIGENHIGIPRGCKEGLIELLEKTGVAYQIEDRTNSGNPIKVRFNGALREEQSLAAEAMLEHDDGVLSATT
ncbi:MAG: helicase, partial [Bacillota bacterium]|nr:helicase [Bacillota bacterium]